MQIKILLWKKVFGKTTLKKNNIIKLDPEEEKKKNKHQAIKTTYKHCR